MGNRNFPWLAWLACLCVVSLVGVLALERASFSTATDAAPVVSQSRKPIPVDEAADASRPNDATVAFPRDASDDAPPPSF